MQRNGKFGRRPSPNGYQFSLRVRNKKILNEGLAVLTNNTLNTQPVVNSSFAKYFEYARQDCSVRNLESIFSR